MTRVKEFNLPDLGEGLTEGEILKWLVGEGDTIALNQPIVEVETAKAAVEIPAKWAGKVTKIFHPEGTTVEVGQPIIAIDTDPGAGDLPAPSAASLAAVEVAGDAPVEPGLIGGPAPGGRTAVLVGYGPRTTVAKRRPRAESASAPVQQPPAVRREPAAPAPAPAPEPRPAPAPAAAPRSGAVLAKPPVRKLARDLGIDLVGIEGTGPGGSITRDDVLGAKSAPPAAAAVRVPGEREERIPVKGVRKLTAENMVASAFTAPHVTEFLTVDVTRSMKALERLKGMREWRDVRVSPLLMVAKAVLLALRRHPMVNSTWAGDEIVVKHYVNLGIAAATQRGLIVPNIKDAQELTTRELADAMTALVGTAREGKTPPADMAGGTFTITSVGMFGVDSGTPILPPGESAILVFGAVREQPWVHKGKIKVRQVTTLGLSFDHRIIDGELGSKFLRDVAAFLEDPEGALLAWG
ncbi:dihydrolipoamide acetyltransferase family protein [Dactylosporangium sp. NPDC048998]|uniref:dihydrolipoamide acetyltransferase family protein n=1 Tax=Dactylosporangium sp. NPDC048998 TaxID=3363976 RepID=UPI00371407D4